MNSSGVQAKLAEAVAAIKKERKFANYGREYYYKRILCTSTFNKKEIRMCWVVCIRTRVDTTQCTYTSTRHKRRHIAVVIWQLAGKAFKPA